MSRHLSIGALAVLGTALLSCSDSATQGVIPQANVGQPTITHFVADGEAASVQWVNVDEAGTRLNGGFLSITRGAFGDHDARLFYVFAVCDENDQCEIVEGGQGPLPNGDASGSKEHFRLSTNTADNPAFEHFAGSGGPMLIEWQSIPVVTETRKGMTEEIFGPGPGSSCDCTIRRRTIGHSTAGHALAAGTFLGFAIGPVQESSIQTNHQVMTEFTRF
jgi:hypothetical protein